MQLLASADNSQEREIPLTYTIVNLQGKQGCKYSVGIYWSPKPKRKKLAEGWPESVEENLERLADAGDSMDSFATLCRNCNGIRLPRSF